MSFRLFNDTASRSDVTKLSASWFSCVGRLCGDVNLDLGVEKDVRKRERMTCTRERKQEGRKEEEKEKER